MTKKQGEGTFRILEQSIPSRGARGCKDSETVACSLCLRNSLWTKVVEEAEFEREWDAGQRQFRTDSGLLEDLYVFRNKMLS